MSVSVSDVGACLIGFIFPYGMFIGFQAPFNLKLDVSQAGRLEKLSYQWLKPLLILSGTFGASASFADRHSDNALVFGILLTAMFVVSLFTYPAGMVAFRQFYGWGNGSGKRGR